MSVPSPPQLRGLASTVPVPRSLQPESEPALSRTGVPRSLGHESVPGAAQPPPPVGSSPAVAPRGGDGGETPLPGAAQPPATPLPRASGPATGIGGAAAGYPGSGGGGGATGACGIGGGAFGRASAGPGGAALAPGPVDLAADRVVTDLREEVAKLERMIHEMTTAPGPSHGSVDAVQKDQLLAKDQRIQQLKQELEVEKHQERSSKNEMPDQLRELEKEHAELRRQLQEAEGAWDITEVGVLNAQVISAERAQMLLQRKLSDLQRNPFLSKMGDRRDIMEKISGLEAKLKENKSECEKFFEANHGVEISLQGVREERQQLQARNAELQMRNAGLQEQMDAHAKEIQRIENEMRLAREKLPQEEREGLERALGALAAGQPATFARPRTAALLEESRASKALAPSGAALAGEPGLMEGVVRRLRDELRQLENQTMALRADIARQAAESRDLKSLYQQDLEDVRQKAHTHLLDREKWQRIAAAHLQSIQDLQKRMAALDSSSGLADQRDEASSTGFSDLSELEGCENAVDIVLGKGEVDSTTAAGLDRTGAVGPDLVQTVISLEMRGFDVACSEVRSGLQPAYDSLVSFGPFLVDDALLEQLSTGRLLLEIRGALPGQQEQQLLGRGFVPLARLVALGPGARRQRPTSVVVSFFDKDDGAIVVARVQLKVQVRYSISELVEDYEHRASLRKQDEEKLRRDLDSKLLETTRALCVQVRRISGLPPAPRQQPNHLRPYVFYQLPGHEPHFTRTGQGPHPVFDDTHHVTLRVDTGLSRWVQQGSTVHFIAFDDAAGSRDGEEALGVIGEARVSLWPLLHNAHAVVEGPFALKKDLSDPASAAAGFMEASVFWQDFASAPAVGAAASTPQAAAAGAAAGPTVPPVPLEQQTGPRWQAASAPMGELEFQAVLGRLVRRLSAKGVRTVEFAFDQLDLRKVGSIERQDFLDGVSQMGLGMSDDELIRLFARLDADGDGTLVLAEWRAALAQCSQADAPQRAEEAWVNAIFDRIRSAMDNRKDLTLQDMFNRLVQGSSGIDYVRFCQLLRAFQPDLHDEHLQRLWLAVDKDRSGFLSFDEFADTFSKPQALQMSAATVAMSDAYFCIISGRLLRRLRTEGFHTIEQVVQAWDRDMDGQLSRQELDQALTAHGLGLSQFERAQFAARIDADGDGKITTAELDTAFRMADAVHGQAERKAQEIFERIRAAIARSAATLSQVFGRLCAGRGVMQRAEFDGFVSQFEPGLDPEQGMLMWQLVDKNLDGCLVYQEFEQIFAPQQQQSPHQLQQQTYAAQPAFAAATGLPATAAGMSEDYFRIVAGRLLRKLLAANFQTVEQVIQRFDQDGDGRISRMEMEQVMAIEAPNLSHFERAQFVARMDADGDGVITASELQAAFALSQSASSQVEQEVQGVFRRIREAMSRSQMPLHQVFTQLCKGGAFMLQADFEDMARRFEQGLDSQRLLHMWQSLDKNNDGALDYQEFAHTFAPRVEDAGPTTTATAAAVHAPSVAASPTAATGVVAQHLPGPPRVSRQSQLATRILQLASAHNVTPEAFFRSMDLNGDGCMSADEFANGLIQHHIGEDRLELRKFFLQIHGAMMGRVPFAKVAEHCVAQSQQPGATAAAPAHAAARPAVQTPTHAAAARQPPSPTHAAAARQPPSPAAAARPAAVAAAAHAATSAEQQAVDVIGRIRGALGRLDPISQVEDVYSRSMKSNKGVLTRSDFDLFVKNFQKTIGQDALTHVWSMMGQHATTAVLPFESFCRQFCPDSLEKAAPQLANGKELLGYLHRLWRWLQERGSTIQTTFAPFDTGGRGGLFFDDFLRACKDSRITLARVEVERIFFRLSLDGGQLAFERLAAAVQEAASVPEAAWTREQVFGINARAAQAGQLLEAAFAQKRKEAVAIVDVQAEFVKHLTLDHEQWATMASFLDKQSDGQVLWRDFLRWAGVVNR